MSWARRLRPGGLSPRCCRWMSLPQPPNSSPGPSSASRAASASRSVPSYAGIYSARLAREWRVLYEIDETKHAVIVLDIRHRSVIYRRR